MTSRRQFLGNSALAASALGFSQLSKLAGAADYGALASLSVDESFVFPEWSAALGALSATSGMTEAWPRKLAGASAHRAGETRLVSLAAPGVELFSLDMARPLATLANDRLAQAIRESSGTMAGMATVSAMDPQAVGEAERSIHGLGMSGISLGSNRGLGLEHKNLYPLYEFASAANVPIYLPAAHAPLAGDAPYRAEGRAGVITGASADSGAHITQLVFGGVLDAFPTLIFVVGRLGEGTPYWVGRVRDTYAALERAGRPLPQRPVEEYFGRSIFLTSSDMSPQTVQYSKAILGEGTVVMSSHSTRSAGLDALTRLDAARVLGRSSIAS
jgi:5-carboxyvanillate decarboxylase